MYSSAIMYTTKPNDLTYGLEKLLKPLKVFNVPVKSLALSISLAIRFIPIIFEQANKIIKSQISRGLNFKGNISQKINKIYSIIIPIFVLSMKRSDSISNTLDMRLYNPNKESTKYKDFRVTDIDDSIVFMHVLLIFIYVVLEVLL